MRIRPQTLGLLVALAVLGAGTTSASATGPPEKPQGKTLADNHKQAQRTASYWTPQRMREARPVEISRSETPPKRSITPSHAKPDGPPVRIPGEPPSSGIERQRAPRSHIPYADYQIDATTYPNVTHGKVFFKVRKRGHHKHKWVKYECSATVVNAENASVVFSAGHCMYDEKRLRWSKKWTFIPGYQNGARPYGKFVAREVWALGGWVDDANFNYDVGAAILRTNASGQRVADAVGSRGIAWDQNPNQIISSYGYPGDNPFDGQTLWVCISPFGGDDPQSYADPGPATSVIGCDQTEGASGGGWVIGNQWLNGVHSYGYDDEPEHAYGPYFGTAVGDLFNEVRGR